MPKRIYKHIYIKRHIIEIGDVERLYYEVIDSINKDYEVFYSYREAKYFYNFLVNEHTEKLKVEQEIREASDLDLWGMDLE